MQRKGDMIWQAVDTVATVNSPHPTTIVYMHRPSVVADNIFHPFKAMVVCHQFSLYQMKKWNGTVDLSLYPIFALHQSHALYFSKVNVPATK